MKLRSELLQLKEASRESSELLRTQTLARGASAFGLGRSKGADETLASDVTELEVSFSPHATHPMPRAAHHHTAIPVACET